MSVCGVNLKDYVPYKRNYDAVTYVHKSYLNAPEDKRQKEQKKKILREVHKAHEEKRSVHNNYVTEQTIRFAEQLAPLIIPPGDAHNAIYYTSTCTKCKRKNKKSQTHSPEIETARQSKKIIEVYRNKKKPTKNSSSRDSFSSTSNTLDDLNNNHSISCTISEEYKLERPPEYTTERPPKKETNNKRKRHDKIVISESFEALATELTDHDERRIKINLMNDTDKHNLIDSIRIPVLNSFKECLSELNNSELKEDVKFLQKYLTCNAQALNNILSRLEIIENHLVTASAGNTPRIHAPKSSMLERLGEDLNEVRNISFEDEIPDQNNVDDVQVLYQDPKRRENKGGGEILETQQTTSVGVKTDKTQRIPARFCWTDAGRNN